MTNPYGRNIALIYDSRSCLNAHLRLIVESDRKNQSGEPDRYQLRYEQNGYSYKPHSYALVDPCQSDALSKDLPMMFMFPSDHPDHPSKWQVQGEHVGPASTTPTPTFRASIAQRLAEEEASSHSASHLESTSSTSSTVLLLPQASLHQARSVKLQTGNKAMINKSLCM